MVTVGSVITRSQQTVGSQAVMLQTLVRNTRIADQLISENAQAIALLTRWLNEPATGQ